MCSSISVWRCHHPLFEPKQEPNKTSTAPGTCTASSRFWRKYFLKNLESLVMEPSPPSGLLGWSVSSGHGRFLGNQFHSADWECWDPSKLADRLPALLQYFELCTQKTHVLSVSFVCVPLGNCMGGLSLGDPGPGQITPVSMFSASFLAHSFAWSLATVLGYIDLDWSSLQLMIHSYPWTLMDFIMFILLLNLLKCIIILSYKKEFMGQLQS